MTVAVFVVNWNGGSLLKRCLTTLLTQHRLPERIIVVDNASHDDSLELAARELRSTQLLRLESNTGFARANNLAAAVANEFDAFALLNPDAFAEPGWLEALVTAAEAAGPDVGSFASQMRLDSDPSRLDGAGDVYHVSGRAWRRDHGAPLADGLPNDADVFGACAAAALYRREAFERVGGFDERYFSYFEDVDLGFRLRLEGYGCRYVHGAVVRHVGSALGGYQSDFAVYHGERNMVWTFVKDMPAPLFWRYLPQHVLLNVAALTFYPWRGQGRVVWRAKFDAIRGLPNTVADRRRIQAAARVDVRELRGALARGLVKPYVRTMKVNKRR